MSVLPRALVVALAIVGLTQVPAAAVAPQAFAASLTTAVNTTANVDLTGNVQDVDTPPGQLTYAVVSPPSHGVLNSCVSGFCTYTPTSGYTGSDSFTWKANDGNADSNVATFSITVTADPNGPPITSAGPLTKVQVSPTLNCAVDHAADGFGAFYQDTACGTLAVVDTVLYGPAALPGAPATSAYTPVSQTGVTGTGTAADPFTLRTTVGLGASGVQLVQTDSYVVGQETYRTDVVVKNSSTPRTVRLYRAGDCQLGDVDGNGTGASGPAGAVACTSGARLLQFLPLTAGSHFYAGPYGDLWSRIAGKQAFPDQCQSCATSIDNGAGLQWDVALSAGQQRTVSSVFTHSTVGAMPLLTTSSVLPTSVAAGDPVTYTVTVTNPGATAATVTEIADTLPTGFVYQAGSTTGATTGNTTSGGGVLRWALSAPVASGGSVSLSFTAIAPGAGGTFTHQAAGAAGPRYVAPSGPTAPVTVIATNAAPVAVDDTLAVSRNNPRNVNVLANDTDADGDPLSITGYTQGAHGAVSCTASLCTYAPAANYAGPDSFTYTINDGKGGTAVGTVAVLVNTRPDAVNDVVSTPRDSARVIDVLVNDVDADGDPRTIQTWSSPAHGSVTCTTTCSYTPHAGYIGPDSFTYTINDGKGAPNSTDTATVAITVTGFDLALTATPVSSSVGIGNLTGYRLAVKNTGNVFSAPATLQAGLPAGFKLRNVAAPGCAALLSSGCSLGQVAPGATVTVLVHGAFVKRGAQPATATVTALDDLNAGNNSGVALTSVSGTDCTRVGTFGNDRLVGTNGRDVLCGLTGNDVFLPQLGNDIVYGGAGTDLVSFASIARAVRIDLARRTATGQGTDVLSSVENAYGSPRADVLIGNSLANLLSGLGGNDVINGNGRNDVLRGGAGADRLSGGPGNDTLNGGPGRDTCFQGAGRGPRISC